MQLLVGLGNPGPKHAGNRHNIGFMAVDEIVRRHGFSPWRSRFQGEIAEATIGGDKVLVLKPMTYMNEVGPLGGRGDALLQSRAGRCDRASMTRSISRRARCG